MACDSFETNYYEKIQTIFEGVAVTMVTRTVFGPVFRSTIVLVLLLTIKAQQECQRGGCFPATGDLLVGRASNLSASSTCGLNGLERYCIVSFLDKTDKCFHCQSTREVDNRRDAYNNSHLPKYMITTSPQDRLKGWWQSQNGVQNVTIQLDLEAEFIFTHLIMTFKTYRPKAMYIERSWNYGDDWTVYRYFAYDCAKSFPNVRRGPQQKVDDVICEERYSRIEPSTGGEVVMKVLDPIIQQKEDPYSVKVQNLLKLTNLRIRFTEFHTFGDDVLGDRPEINQKYYYAIYEMVVRGSCSCYGHAEQCIAAGVTRNRDMVHGKCNCTHNTAGRNCEHCKDGYADEPWRPAYTDQLNICRKCNCNGHTEKCHFDPAVYNATGRTSGGVCDDCQHNTTGRQCEQCKLLYYRDPFKNIFDPDVCKPCDCDPSGSTGGGECETVTDPGARQSNGQIGTVAGRCRCKANVEGPRCDRCKDGYWNMLESNPDGCQSCNCDGRGTISQQKCNQLDGDCRCKRYVEGARCSKCLNGYWSLGSAPEGCQACDCDIGGSHNTTCDDISGKCDCRPNLMGRKCDQVRPGHYFANLDHIKYEGENAIPGRGGTPFKVIRIFTSGEGSTFTGQGYLQVQEGSLIDFTMIRVPYSGRYNFVMRYDTLSSGDWDDVRLKVSRADGGKLAGATCGFNEQTQFDLQTVLRKDQKAVFVDKNVCLEKGVVYNVQIDFKSNNGHGNGQTLLDSIILVPKVENLSMFQGVEGDERRSLYNSYNCRQYYLETNRADEAPEVCKNLQFSISSIMNNGGLPCQCDPVGTESSGSIDILTCKAAGGQCPCKPGVIGRRCDQCAAGNYGFDADGCKACACNRTGSTSEFCHDTTGQCQCLPQLVGRKCDSCPVNYYDFPNCKPCQCSGHSSTCDAKTGVCTNCDHNAAGENCEQCAEGYYGDATKGTENDCQRCQCPGGGSGNQFSNICHEKTNGKVVCTNCTDEYTGDQCEKCGDGYFGNPVVTGGICIKCDCSGNIDPLANGKCDATTGTCNDCVNNAAGNHCEKCKPGYFGNAKNQTCKECVCNSLGTEPDYGGICNEVTGQCPCLQNVNGLQCDKCSPGFYNLASGKGCISCECDKEGSLEGSCNQLDGQCRCRVGFGGRSCSECEDNKWGNPKIPNGCNACGCNPVGSTTLQCNRTTGVCDCKQNVVGEKCNMCAPRTSDVMPKCENCHACNDQWEDIVKTLEEKVKNLIRLRGNFTFNASEIALYTKEIQELKTHLKTIEAMFGNRSVEAGEVDDVRRRLQQFRNELMDLDKEADKYVEIVRNTAIRNKNANDELDKLDIRAAKLKNNTLEFKTNVTEVIESNIGGALNSTRDSLRRSREAQKVVDNSEQKIKDSKKLRRQIKKEIIMSTPSFEELDNNNNELVDNLTSRVSDLELKLKELNELLCGDAGTCGGCTAAGCETCGASLNCTGIKQLANMALEKAGEAKSTLLQKKTNAEQTLRDIKMAEIAVNFSFDASEAAEVSSNKAKEIGEAALKNITTLIKDVTDFLNEEFKHPNVSKMLAQETLSLNISLTPAQVKDLARQIKVAVKNISGVDKILNESRKDYDIAIKLKEEALRAKKFALFVMNKTRNVLDKLEEAMELQNSTTDNIAMARNEIEDVNTIIEQIKAKLNIIDRDLRKAGNDTDNLEKKKAMISDMFADNRKRLAEAETEAENAEKLANEVNKTSVTVEQKYDQTKDKLNDKINMTKIVQKRVQRLGDEAIELFAASALKLKQLNDLKTRYTKNEERVQDLLDQIKRLEIKGTTVRNRLQALSACHGDCNADIAQPICVSVLEQVDEEGKVRLKELEDAIKNRISTKDQ